MIRTIIIDDEFNSRQILRGLLNRLCPEVSIVGEAADGEEGLTLVKSISTDLVFLDIEMPHKNGFELLSHWPERRAEIIFTTAYQEYAAKAFRISALDYLMKPIDPDELLAALHKFRSHSQMVSRPEQYALLQQTWEQENKNNDPSTQRLALVNQDGVHLVSIHQIIWCEALGSYTKFHLQEQPPLVVSRIIKEYEEILTPFGFIRIHQSYLINKACILRYIKGTGGQVVLSDGSELEVSRRRKEEIWQALQPYVR